MSYKLKALDYVDTCFVDSPHANLKNEVIFYNIHKDPGRLNTIPWPALRVIKVKTYKSKLLKVMYVSN